MFFQYSELTFFEREVYIVEDKIVNKDSPFLCMYWNPEDGTSWNPGGGGTKQEPSNAHQMNTTNRKNNSLFSD